MDANGHRIGAKVPSHLVREWAAQAADAVRMVLGYGHDPKEAVDTLRRLAGEMEMIANITDLRDID